MPVKFNAHDRLAKDLIAWFGNELNELSFADILIMAPTAQIEVAACFHKAMEDFEIDPGNLSYLYQPQEFYTLVARWSERFAERIEREILEHAYPEDDEIFTDYELMQMREAASEILRAAEKVDPEAEK